MMKIYCNLNDLFSNLCYLFSSLDITALSHFCQIGSQCYLSPLQNIVERFSFFCSVLILRNIFRYKMARPVCITKTDLAASAAIVVLLLGLCTRRLTKSDLDATFEVLTAVLLKIEVF
jgi:hypothetical protein